MKPTLASFTSAVPVWAAGREQEINLWLSFRTETKNSKKTVLRLTGSSAYVVKVDRDIRRFRTCAVCARLLPRRRARPHPICEAGRKHRHRHGRRLQLQFLLSSRPAILSLRRIRRGRQDNRRYRQIRFSLPGGHGA